MNMKDKLTDRTQSSPEMIEYRATLYCTTSRLAISLRNMDNLFNNTTSIQETTSTTFGLGNFWIEGVGIGVISVFGLLGK